MASISNYKLKILYIMQYLEQYSDELHPITVADIMDELSKRGISAERKSIYDDLEVLRVFGMDIVSCRGKNGGYYLGRRAFALPELKLLVDSVQSSKFITQGNTMTLIKKIESLANVYDAKLLHRQVFVRNRVKSMNESVYLNVDEISTAISRNYMLRFRYFEYALNKERRLRHNGAPYHVSPFALLWDDENYYLLAYDSASGLIKHFRVDKMTDIQTVCLPREGMDKFAEIDVSAYTKQVFGMFSGTQERVKLRFTNRLVGAVIDRFGRDVVIIRDGDTHFCVNVDVAVSPRFFAWMFGFGEEAEIISPASVREGMADHVRSVMKLYLND